MHDVNLSAGRMWSFADDSGDVIRLSLPDVLLSDVPLHHSPLPGYLASIQHELLSSILQVAIDKLNLINIYKMSAYALKLNDIEFGSLFSL